MQYRLDKARGTATMVWQYRHDPSLYSPFAGSAQRLVNGNTFVAFGVKPVVVEVRPDGTVVWEGRVSNNGAPVPFIYRAMRVASLYRFERP